MNISKRITRNTRRINTNLRTTALLREEVNSLTEELDGLRTIVDRQSVEIAELHRRFHILHTILKEDT